MKLMPKLRSVLKMDNRGVLGLETVGQVIITLLVLAVTAVAVFLALVSLQNANLFGTSTASANNTNYIINNITGGTTQFFNNIPTIMTIMGAVVIILAVTLILYAVYRFSSNTSGGL